MAANNKLYKIDPLAFRKGIFYFRACLLCLLFFAVQLAVAQPKLIVKESRKNFGQVKRGEVVVASYEISNDGNQPLILNGAEVACSCTMVDFPKQPVSPSGTATVVVTFKTATVYGRQDRIVMLNSNDPSGPAKLRFKANVSKE